jgi:hypothetical protein
MPRKKRASKKKVTELNQTHGMQETVEPTTLEQVWGDDGLGKYKTLDLESYESDINGMNKSDLQAHAQRLGLLPIDNRVELQARLVREFKKHVSSYQKPTNHTWTTKNVDEEEVRRLLQ